MFFGMTAYQIFWYFLIYSFIGWIIEVAFHAVTLGKVVNRGFLNGPICPVYGFGMLLVLMINHLLPVSEKTLEVNIWLVFISGALFTTIVELIAGWALDKLFHARWWDYSDMPLNLHGYICLAFSIIWGISVMIAVRFVHPLVNSFSPVIIPARFGWWILGLLYTVVFVDLGITIATVRGLNKELKKIDELRQILRKPSDKMSETITETTLKVATSVEKAQVQAALGKAELKDNLEDYKKLAAKKYAEAFASTKWGTKRLLRAFPHIKHSQYAETLQELKKYISELKKH